MKKFIFAVFSLLCAFSPATASARKPVMPIVVSQSGEFLGLVFNNEYDAKSICNQYGKYGSPYAQTIFNKYGTHGGEYSDTGAYNPRAKNPPIVIVNNQVVGFVTKNPQFGKARIDPDILLVQACGR
ncbi:MAG: hypothetical protein WBA41_30230 [Rivularia sp. (in: cyanobacteria)]